MFSNCTPVSLEEMLAAREKRAETQREIIGKFQSAIICFTMNMPGPYKRFDLLDHAFDEGSRLLLRRIGDIGAALAFHRELRENTGCEGFYAVKADAAALKRLAIELEERHPLGRLFDIDVFDEEGTRVAGADFGRAERRCLICGEPVWQCGHSRAHTAEELSLKAAGLLQSYYDEAFAERVAALAQRALLYEVAATPKPGLVDRANNGAHKDMNFFTFLESASVLGPFFRRCALRGMSGAEPENLLEELRLCGVMAEDEMLLATKGVNTHRGAIFSLGILAAAAGYLYRRGEALRVGRLSEICGRIAGRTREALPATAMSHGGAVYQKYGLTGIRGEAASGFASAVSFGLPALKKAGEDGLDMNAACVSALLELLAVVEDTNVVHRGGPKALQELQARIKTAKTGDRLCFAKELDIDLSRRGISPGGCADLLAVSLMLKFLTDGDEDEKINSV
jgi:holo-ACP synthase/triphosphoribosyl-dephospho-CoA synthase